MTKSKIPQFKNEKEESEFWDIHDSTAFFDEFKEVDIDIIDAQPRLKQISLRLDPPSPFAPSAPIHKVPKPSARGCAFPPA